MSVLFIVLPLALLLALCAVVVFSWAVRSGQFDDLDSPPARMLDDDGEDGPRRPPGGTRGAGRPAGPAPR